MEGAVNDHEHKSQTWLNLMSDAIWINEIPCTWAACPKCYLLVMLLPPLLLLFAQCAVCSHDRGVGHEFCSYGNTGGVWWKDSWRLEEQWGLQGTNESLCAVRDDFRHWATSWQCLRLVLRPGGQKRLSPLVSWLMCAHVSTDQLKIVTPWGGRREEKKVALTLMTFFWQVHSSDPPLVHTHSARCLSQIVVVFATSKTTSTALGELEFIPAVLKKLVRLHPGPVTSLSQAHTKRQTTIRPPTLDCVRKLE